jgi:hypothetical protein
VLERTKQRNKNERGPLRRVIRSALEGLQAAKKDRRRKRRHLGHLAEGNSKAPENIFKNLLASTEEQV